MSGPIVLIVAGVVVLVGSYAWYVSLIARRNKVREAMSSVDLHLTQRHDLIPNIVKLAGRFMEHERELLADLARLREQAAQSAGASPGEISKRFEVEGALGQRIGPLFARMEASARCTSCRARSLADWPSPPRRTA